MNFPIAQLKTTGSIKQTKIMPTQSKAPGAYPFGIFDQPVMIPIGPTKPAGRLPDESDLADEPANDFKHSES